MGVGVGNEGVACIGLEGEGGALISRTKTL